MSPRDELQDLVDQYARGEFSEEELLRRLDAQREELRRLREAERRQQEARVARTHAAIRRIGRL